MGTSALVWPVPSGPETDITCGVRVQGSGFRVQGSGFRVQGSWFMVQGSGSGSAPSGPETDMTCRKVDLRLPGKGTSNAHGARQSSQ